MKKITSSIYLFLVIFCIGPLQAQEGISYTLIDNGGLSYSIAAVANDTGSTFNPIVQSYGFTIIVTAGVTATITSSFANGASATPFTGTAINDNFPTVEDYSDIDGYLITEVLNTPLNLPAPSSQTVTPMVTIQLDSPFPTASISLLANDSLLTDAVPALESFMSADMIDDGTFLFPAVVDFVGSGLSGSTSFEVINNTLSIDTEDQLSTFEIYPNPVKDTLTIKGLDNDVTKIEVFNTTGQSILSVFNHFETIDVSHISNGIYFLNLYTNTGTTTLKLIKE